MNEWMNELMLSGSFLGKKDVYVMGKWMNEWMNAELKIHWMSTA